jgi:LacI family transcriptional regulator
MAHRATIHDLADKAGVSVSTIDRLLNGRDKVREKTAAKVLAAAEELNFYALPLLQGRLLGQKPKIKLGFLLQQSNRTFYQSIAEALKTAEVASAEPVEVVVRHINNLSPEAVAENIQAIGQEVQSLAVISAQHARVAHAIEMLAGNNVRTYGLISELSANCGVGYIGLDNWRVGRTAGWALKGLCHPSGRIGILIGNHRYRCQELNESGFRSYLRENGAGFTPLDPIQTFEDRAIARDVTEQLLRREPDLAGLYVAGGGMSGVLEALRASRRSKPIFVVGQELTDFNRMGLMDNVVSIVLAHPIARLATEAIDHMLRDYNDDVSTPAKRILGFEIYTPENI